MTDQGVMTEEEVLIAKSVYDAIQRASNFSERSMQSKDFRVGVSDLGFCSEYTKRMLKGEEPEWESDALAAFIGTAVGDHAETAIKQYLWPHAIIQSEVEVVLEGEDRIYTLPGHPDVIDPADGILIDLKTVNGLEIVKRIGPKLSQQFQRHCYAKAAWTAGMFGDRPLEEVRVANVWIDRSGKDHELWVDMEPYSEDVVREAGMWLDEVVYGYLHDSEVPKEPPREFCEVWCGFYATCRALDTDVEGLLTDPEVIAAVDMQQEALDLERKAKRLKAVAKGALTGVSGSTGEFAVRWVHVNGGPVSYERAGYEKLDIRKVK